MDNITYALNLLKNSVDTLKYDRIMADASKNPATQITTEDFINKIEKIDFSIFFDVAGKKVWEDSLSLDMAALKISTQTREYLKLSISDLDGNPTMEDVLIGFAFRYLRRTLSAYPKNVGSKYGVGRLNVQKDTPLMFNFTFNALEWEAKDDSAIITLSSRPDDGEGGDSLAYWASASPYFVYRSMNQEVIRVNFDDIVYSENEKYGDAASIASASSSRVAADEDMEYVHKFYGTPNPKEIKGIVDSSYLLFDEIANKEEEFSFEINREKQKEILASCFGASQMVIVNEASQIISLQNTFDSVIENQICVIIVENTVKNPKNSVNIPFSGFYAMMQVAYDLNRTKFRVINSEVNTFIDFSFDEKKTVKKYVSEGGKRVLKDVIEDDFYPAFYKFNPESCTSTISATFYAKEQDLIIKTEASTSQGEKVKKLNLSNALISRSVYKNKRWIMLDSLEEWSQAESSDGYYSIALNIATRYVEQYTTVRKDKISASQVRVFDKRIFDENKALLENEKIGDDRKDLLENSYVWNVQERFWDLNPKFTVERTLQYFIGMGLGKSKEKDNAYRVLCARILGIDYFQHYESLVLGALKSEDSELYLDASSLPFDENGNIDEDKMKALKLPEMVRSEGEYVRKNLYSLKKQTNHESFTRYIDSIGGLNAQEQVQRHIICIKKYLPKEAKFFFERNFKEYELSVKNKGLGRAYLAKKSFGSYEVEDVSEDERITNADYEMRRIVIPNGLNTRFIDEYDYFGQENVTAVYPSNYVLGEGDAQSGFMSSQSLNSLLYNQQSRPSDVKKVMYNAGVSLSSNEIKLDSDNEVEDIEEEVNTENVQMTLNDFAGYNNKSEVIKTIKNPALNYFKNPEVADLEVVKQMKTYVLGSLPTRNSLWKFQEPFLWTNYADILTKLKGLGLLEESDDYITKEVGVIIINRIDAEYKKLFTKAQIIGDEIFSFRMSSNSVTNYQAVENNFNQSFNNAPDKRGNDYNDAPIFIEHSRNFAKIEDKKNFDLRPSQLQGLRFLGGAGNSGILAHEVGFGKTTTSIAKISDMFLRGEASRVLIIAPTNEVYNKWFEEIRGSQTTLGVFDLDTNVIGLGNLAFESLRGKAIGTNPKKQELFGKYDGAFEYSEAQREFIAIAGEIGKEILKELGGRGQRLKNWTEEAAIKSADIFLEERLPQTTKSATLIKLPKPVRWYGGSKELIWEKSKVVTFNDRTGVEYDVVNKAITQIANKKSFSVGTISDISDDKVISSNTLFGLIYQTAKNKMKSKITPEDLNGLWDYIKEIEIRHKQSFSQRLSSYVKFKEGKAKGLNYSGTLKAIPLPTVAYAEIMSFSPMVKNTNDSGGIKGNDDYYDYSGGTGSGNFFVAKSKPILSAYALNVAAYVLSDGKIQIEHPKSSGAYALVPHIRKSILSMSKKNISDKFFDGMSTNAILKQDQNYLSSGGAKQRFELLVDGLSAIVLSENDKTNRRYNGEYVGENQWSFEVKGKDIYSDLAIGNMQSAAELEMTSELAEVMDNLKSISLCIGTLKNVAKKPKTIFIALKTAVGKFKIPYENSLKSALVLNDFPDNEEVIIKNFKSKLLNDNEAYLRGSLYLSLAANQLNAINIARLSIDAMIVDEVHNFNRGFTKSSNLAMRRLDGDSKVRQISRTTENRGNETAVQTFSAKAKYNVRADVQNFGALCYFVGSVSDKKYSTPNRRVNNNIFLSATPFTDDNFQAYTLFRFLDGELLNSLGINSLAKFYRLYAKEIYKIDVNISGNVGLFPVIDGYKNSYVLSRLIASFSDFAVTDAEIDKRRPHKIIIANSVDYPENAGVQDGDFKKLIDSIRDNKMNSFISKSEAQKNMSQDASDYIVGKISSPIRSNSEQIEASDYIYEDILDWKKRTGYVSKDIKEMEDLLKKLSPLLKSVTKTKDGEKRKTYEIKNAKDVDEVTELLSEGMSIDPNNIQLQAYQMAYDQQENDDDIYAEINDFGGADSQAALSSRTMQMAGISALTLLSPYFITTDEKSSNFKKGDNPYLPPLNFKDKKGDYVFDDYENAKTFVENSPKIYYACSAIAQQIKHQKDKEEKIAGSIVYSQYYKFTYHGHSFKIFDLMSRYILGKNPELFKEDYLGNSTKSLSVEDKLDLFFAQIVGKKTKGDEVGRFNSGEVYVLFGTDTIKEGVDLQKNSVFLYVLTVGYVPVTFMQLHGRMWRQGNPFKYCFIVNVLVRNSIDAFQYSKLDQKIKAVKAMLEGGVYDANETQFDVDVQEIKIHLINDAKKLAELDFEERKDEISTNAKTLESQIKTLSLIEHRLASIFPDYKEKAKNVAHVYNEYCKVYLFLLVSEQNIKDIKEEYTSVKNGLGESDFNSQFVTEEEREAYKKDEKSWRALSNEERESATKSKSKKWKYFLSKKSDKAITGSLKDTDPRVISLVNSSGNIPDYAASRTKVLSNKEYRYLASEVNPDPSGYIPYSIYDELHSNYNTISENFNKNEENSSFISEYNKWMKLVLDYKSGTIKAEELVKNYKSQKTAVLNALFIAYILMPMQKFTDDSAHSIDLDKIDEEKYAKVYESALNRHSSYSNDGGKRVASYEAIPARQVFNDVTSYADDPIDSRDYSEVLQGFERLLRGRGENGKDIDVAEIDALQTSFQKEVDTYNEVLKKPAQTKAALAKKYQDKLDAIASESDFDIEQKIKDLSALYPLIIKKEEN